MGFIKNIAQDIARGACQHTNTVSVKCKQGKIEIRYSVRPATPIEAVKAGLAKPTPSIVAQCTDSVQIIITTTKGRVSARFKATEFAEMFGDRWPSADDFDRLHAAVLSRKAYPLPEPEIPGGGGKSMTAQGQTKKPGSHSSDRHS